MRIALRWLGYALGLVVVLALLAVAYVWIASSRELTRTVEARPERLVPVTPAALADAERRARTLGCFNCHGPSLQGRKFLDDAKVATIHSPNLAELAHRVSDQQLARALRQGISHDGRPLLVMPSEAYQYLTDEETSALVAYMRQLPRSGARSADPELGPLGRVGMINGMLKTAPAWIAEYRRRPAADLGPQHALGRHLAVTTCAGCHGSDLSGRQVDPENLAPDLTIVGAYDLPAFTRLLREGVAPGDKKLGLMREAALNDSRHYTDAEIARLHAYLVARAQR